MKYDFDRVVERKGTGSTKWMKYPDHVTPHWIADMDFPCALEIMDAMEKRVKHPVFGYARPSKEMYAELADFLSESYNWSVDPEDIVFVPGVTTVINMAALALLEPEDELIVFPPVYPPLLDVAENCGSSALEIPLIQDDSGYHIDFESMEKSVSSRTKMLLLCNPHNPVGRVFTREELEKIAEFCIHHDLYVVSDEIHCGLIFEGRKHIPIASLNPEIANRSITGMAASKTYNIAGMKCSFMVIHNKELRDKVASMTMGLVDSVNALGLEASRAAYEKGGEWLDQLLPYLEENRNYLVDFLAKELPLAGCIAPEASFLAWIDLSSYQLGENPAQFLLDSADIGCSNGAEFGKEGDGFIRFNFGCPRSVLEDSLFKMKEAILKKFNAN